jgi:hypothetical protein
LDIDGFFSDFRVDKTLEIKIRRNEVYLEDSLFSIFEAEPIYFNNVVDYKLFEKSTYGYSNIQIIIKLDEVVEQHRRRVLTFLEVTGTLGGIFEVFEFGVGAIIGICTSYMFKNDLRDELQKSEAQYREVKMELEALKARFEDSKTIQKASMPVQQPQDEELSHLQGNRGNHFSSYRSMGRQSLYQYEGGESELNNETSHLVEAVPGDTLDAFEKELD